MSESRTQESAGMNDEDMNNNKRPLGLFEGYGVELEYMIVDSQTLDVRPITDELLRSIAGEITSDVEFGDITWSNELVLHVVEFKTTGPAKRLEGLAAEFAENAVRANNLLKSMGAQLMPTGMHPWMEPARETRLWPHDCSPVYNQFDRVFGCQGHGWSNLQSVHINLPWSNAEEFGKLHAAIRVLLPIMPALSASSPIVEGLSTGVLDNRLEVYRFNARRVPSVSGKVIPEQAFTPDEYHERILKKVYADIAPFDPEGILQHEWLNARGAIARFNRNTIEIRVLDIQECPQADLAIYALIAETLRGLIEGRWSSLEDQKKWGEQTLADIFLPVVREAGESIITNQRYLELFGLARPRASARELWEHLAGQVFPASSGASVTWRPALEVILGQGSLASRILKAAKADFRKPKLKEIYARLCECLAANRMFIP